MTGSPIKEPPTGAHDRSAGKPQESVDKTGTEKSEEKALAQHNANLENAGALIRHALDTVKKTGVDRSLIAIQKTVRYWPSLIDKSNSASAFDPPFNATGITVESKTEENHTTTNVSFSYLGETYNFVFKLENASSSGYTLGTITLYENGERVISIAIVQSQNQEQVSFRELNAFKYGSWIEKITRMEAEIEQHNNRLANRSNRQLT